MGHPHSAIYRNAERGLRRNAERGLRVMAERLRVAPFLSRTLGQAASLFEVDGLTKCFGIIALSTLAEIGNGCRNPRPSSQKAGCDSRRRVLKDLSVVPGTAPYRNRTSLGCGQSLSR